MTENYLDFIPCRNVLWSKSENNTVTLEIENKGILKKLTQLFAKKARISYIHLDKYGSFIWQNIDGNSSISEIGKLVKAEFGDSVEPLHERLINFFKILKSYKFITWKL